jgi:hypothetical protein
MASLDFVADQFLGGVPPGTLPPMLIAFTNTLKDADIRISMIAAAYRCRSQHRRADTSQIAP